jgi:hypothetical protein
MEQDIAGIDFCRYRVGEVELFMSSCYHFIGFFR